MHDVLSVAITVATILIASYFNQTAINSLRGEMDSLRTDLNGKFESLRSELNGKIDAIHRDMREFYAGQARHNMRLTTLQRTSDPR